jgi:hypothetical protein
MSSKMMISMVPRLIALSYRDCSLLSDAILWATPERDDFGPIRVGTDVAKQLLQPIFIHHVMNTPQRIQWLPGCPQISTDFR